MDQAAAARIAASATFDGTRPAEYHPLVQVERWVAASIQQGSVHRRLFGACQKAGADYNAAVERIGAAG